MPDSEIRIYVDGACSGNPGPGGWGYVFYGPYGNKEGYGGHENTTNNRMELTAAIEALRFLGGIKQATIYADAKYLVDGITKWLPKWKTNGWTAGKRQGVKNRDLWMQLDELNSMHEITWCWVKGHNGNHGNERADQLAHMGVQQAKERAPIPAPSSGVAVTPVMTQPAKKSVALAIVAQFAELSETEQSEVLTILQSLHNLNKPANQ